MAKKKSKTTKKKEPKLDAELVVAVAEDMNSALGLDPEIDTDLDTDEIMERIEEESKELYSDDSLEDDTWDFLEEHFGVDKEELSEYSEDNDSGENNDEDEEEEPEDDSSAKGKGKKSGSKSSSKKSSKKSGKSSKKAGKKKDSKASGKKGKTPPKKVGVIAAIKKAISKKGRTKTEILEILEEEFPDRDPAAMKKTISCQIPYQLSQKGYELVKMKGDKWKIDKSPE